MGSAEDLASTLGSASLNDDSDLMVIGIDFGTTNSGVAWATVEDFKNHQVNVITSWPGRGEEEGKTPTELYYSGRDIRWGYDIPPEAEPLRWFKLLLLQEEDLSQNVQSSEFLRHGRRYLKGHDKSAIDLIADYLRLIWEHSIHIIKKSRGDMVIEALRFHVVITVPAIWKGYARQGMKEAVGRSGILDHRAAGETKFTFAPEPEAAALSTLCEKGRKVQPDDVYVICDAGGGTVDLISYKVDQAQPIAISEAVEGTGDLCGGIFIDEAFEKICSSRLGAMWGRLSKAGVKEVIGGDWERHIKPQFKDPKSNKDWIVRVPAEAFANADEQNDTTQEPSIQSGRIHFKGSHIVDTFQKSVLGIEKLIDEQIELAKQKGLDVTGVVLVGGLGASLYIYEYLQNKYQSKDISVLQSGGIQPRTAICRGAVYKGFIDGLSAVGEEWPLKGFKIDMPIKVTSTISRGSFGIVISEPFEEGKHLEKDKKWDEDEGKFMAKGQMKWYLKKGDNVSKLDAIRHPFYSNLTGFQINDYTVQLVQCSEAAPPARKTSVVKDYVEIHCTLLSSDLDDWTTATSKRMKRIHFDLEMIPSGASMDFKVHCKGRVVGEKDVSISFAQAKGSPGKGGDEPCRYDSDCTNTKCAFQHTVRVCPRGESCSYMKCRDRHAKKACLYGFNCRNRNGSCRYRHPTAAQKGNRRPANEGPWRRGGR